MGLRFAPAETTQVYMELLQDYCREHGRPVALYSDKHSIFRVNHPDKEGEIIVPFSTAPGHTRNFRRCDRVFHRL